MEKRGARRRAEGGQAELDWVVREFANLRVSLRFLFPTNGKMGSEWRKRRTLEKKSIEALKRRESELQGEGLWERSGLGPRREEC